MATQVVERMGTASAMTSSSGAHVPVALSRSTASVSTAGWAKPGMHRQLWSGVGLVGGGRELERFVGRRDSTVVSGASLVCRSSVSPLANSSGNVMEFQSKEEFDTILSEAGDKLVVVDISTTTCGPCKMIFPKLVEMSLTYPDAVFLKINGDTNSATRTLMREWGVKAVPNFRFFKSGKQVHSHTGAKLDELKTRFAEHYGQPIKV